MDFIEQISLENVLNVKEANSKVWIALETTWIWSQATGGRGRITRTKNGTGTSPQISTTLLLHMILDKVRTSLIILTLCRNLPSVLEKGQSVNYSSWVLWLVTSELKFCFVCLFPGHFLKICSNRESRIGEEKSLRYVAMEAKFLDDNKTKKPLILKSGFALFQTLSILFNFF